MNKRRIIALTVVAVMLVCIFAAFAACKDKGFTVTFETSDGSAVSPMTNVKVIETAPESTKDGFVLVGWFEDPELTKQVTFPYTVERDITLYAKWEVPTTGENVFNMAKDGAVAFAANSADAIASGSFNIGADIALVLGQTTYDASMAVSMDAADQDKNQAKLVINKNGAVYFAVYLYNGLLYIDDGTGVRKFALTGDGSTIAPNLAATISNAIAEFTGSGEQVETEFANAYKGIITTLVPVAMSLVDARQLEDGSYETDDFLNSLFINAEESLGGFAGVAKIISLAGLDLKEYDDVFKTLLGYTYTELEAGGFSKDATPFADIRLGVKLNDDNTLNKVWLSRTLGEDVISLTISDITVGTGTKEVVDAEALAAAVPGALHITGMTYIGDLPVYTDIKISVDLNDQQGNMIVIKGGSAPGLDDYFTTIYDGKRVVPIRQMTATGKNINTTYGGLLFSFTSKFCKLTKFQENINLPDDYGLNVYFPALDLHELLNTVIPLVDEFMNGEEGTTEDPADTGESAEESGSFDISQLIDRLVVDGGIGLNLDYAFLESLINIDIWQTLVDLMPTVEVALNRAPDMELLVTNLLGIAFEGKTAQEIVDDNSIDLILSLPEGDAFEVGLQVNVYDSKRPEAGKVTEGTFTIGFSDEPVVDGRWAEYEIVSTGRDVEEFIDEPGYDGDTTYALAVMSTDKTATTVMHSGNLVYYMTLVSALINVMQWGGFM